MAMIGGARRRVGLTPVDQVPEIMDLLALNGMNGASAPADESTTNATTSRGGMGRQSSPVYGPNANSESFTGSGYGAGAEPQPSLATLGTPQAQPSAPGRMGMFGRMAGWMQKPVGNGSMNRADLFSLLGATLRDTGAGLAGRDGGALEAWQGGMAERALADGMGQGMGGVGPDGQPMSPAQQFQRMQIAALKAGARGARVGSYLSMLPGMRQQANEDAYLATVPEKDRTLAALNPTGYASNQLQLSTPKIENVPYGGSLVSVDPRTGQTRSVFQGQAKPEPLSVDRVTAEALQAYLSGKATPEQQAIVKRHLEGTDGDKTNVSQQLGEVIQKYRQGLPRTPAEDALLRDYLASGNGDPIKAMIAQEMQASGFGSPGGGSAASGARAPAPAARGGAAAGGTPPVSKLQNGVVTHFKNGMGSWTLRNGKAVRVD